MGINVALTRLVSQSNMEPPLKKPKFGFSREEAALKIVRWWKGQPVQNRLLYLCKECTSLLGNIPPYASSSDAEKYLASRRYDDLLRTLFVKFDCLLKIRQGTEPTKLESVAVFRDCLLRSPDKPCERAFVESWNRLMTLAKNGSIPSSALEDFSTKSRELYDASVLERGVLNPFYFRVHRNLLEELYKEKQDTTQAARTNEKILYIQGELRKYCNDQVWEWHKRKFPGSVKEKPCTKTVSIFHNYLLGRQFSLMGKCRYFRHSVNVKEDGLECFLGVDRVIFKSMEKTRTFDVKKDVVLKRIYKMIQTPWVLSPQKSEVLKKIEEGGFSDLASFRRLFDSVCGIFRDGILSRKDAFESTLALVNDKFASNAPPHVLYLHGLKFMFYWAEILRADYTSMSMAHKVKTSRPLLVEAEREYWESTLASGCEKSFHWMNFSIKMHFLETGGILAIFKNMMVDLMVTPMECPEVLLLDQEDLGLSRKIFQWSVCFQACCMTLGKEKSVEFWDILSPRIHFPGQSETTLPGDEILQVFLNDVHGRDLKHGIEQLAAENVVGDKACEYTVELARKLGPPDFDVSYPENLRHAFGITVEQWKSSIFANERAATATFARLAEFNFEMHKSFYMHHIPWMLQQVYNGFV